MFNMKHLINSKKNMNNKISPNNLGDDDLMGAIIDVLSTQSRNDKQYMIAFKQRIRSTLDFDPSSLEDSELFKDFSKKVNDLVLNDEKATDILTSLNILKRLKLIWLWRFEESQEYGDDLDSMPENLREGVKFVSKWFSKYAHTFSSLYEKFWTDYVLKYQKVPSYIYLLKKVFISYVWNYIKQSLNNMKFSEEECQEWFLAIQEVLGEKWINLEASENIKLDFIKLCREKYPLAPKKDDFLFENKSFRQNIVRILSEWVDQYVAAAFDNIVKDFNENYYNRIKEHMNSKDNENNWPNEEEIQFVWLLNMILCTIATINWFVYEWTWDGETIALYFWWISDQFEYDHKKKLEKLSENKNTLVPHKKDILNSEILIQENVKSWEDYLSENENNLINEAVSYINCDKKRNIIKYLTKLKIKDLPLRFYDFKRLFNLKEIPPQTESILIDQLWMDYEVEEEFLKMKEEEQVEYMEEKWDEWKIDQITIQENIEVDNPTSYLIDKLKSVWCIIDNEIIAEKQINQFCLNDNYKTVLINLMTSPRFGKVFLHKAGHKTARSLRIGRTGWRILFEKTWDGNLHFVCFANHNYYEDRLAKLK